MFLVSSSFSFILIGGRFPVDNLLSYGRILTLHYYYLLTYILWIHSIFHSHHFMIKDILNKNDDHALFFHLFAKL